METILILVVAAGLSAGVVWWAMAPPEGRPRGKESGRLSFRETFQTTGPDPLGEEPGPDGFVLLPADGAAVPDDRPSPTRSLLRIALAITFVAAVAVAVLALLGFLVKTQLDQYFT